MKFKYKKYILILSIFVLFLNLKPVNELKEKTLLQIIQQGLEAWHYSGKKTDNYFSETGFKEYLKYLDYNKRFLLKSDIEEFERYKDRIDDQLLKGKPELMKIASEKISLRINHILGIINDLLSKPFDYTKNENILFSPDKREYFTNKSEQREYWRKLLKYESLNRYITNLKSKKLSVKSIDKKIEKKVREQVSKSYVRKLKRKLKTNEKDAISLFLNSIIQVFDPHTAYFPPKQLEDFDIEMTGKLEGIGALLGEKEGYVSVVRIIPGGPSWKQKELQAGDLILKVGQKDKEPLDIIGMRTVDAVKYIRGKKGTLVKLTVKKPDGRIIVIPIVRDIVVIEETFAKSAIIKEKSTNSLYGYIYLPGFYNDFKNKNGRKSSEDVKKELINLKSQNIEGLILDLRGNSGGALNDAISLSGLFIKKGPILQTKNRHTGIRILNDPDPDIQFDKPLIVLVNSLSASASEIVAAALQDYGRAIIVGGSHSFGKGTVQMMIDLNRFRRNQESKNDSLGAFKITIQKFYRITGSSNQYEGVIPDIILPDRFDHLKIGEKFYDHPLKSDTIRSLEYKKWESKISNFNKIKQLSKNRVKNNSGFSIIKRYIEKLKEIRKLNLYSLNLKKAFKEQLSLEKEMKIINKKEKQLKDFSIISLSLNRRFNSEKLKKVAEEMEKTWHEEMEKDLYLNESLLILRDIINNSKKNS
ncbi:MAG: carboxy terminal-processing peptidase [Acidobacteriota bacterium]